MKKEQLKDLRRGNKVHCIMLDGSKTNGVIKDITDTAIVCDDNYIPISKIQYIRGLKKLDEAVEKKITKNAKELKAHTIVKVKDLKLNKIVKDTAKTDKVKKDKK